jgi:hypothetical protein
MIWTRRAPQEITPVISHLKKIIGCESTHVCILIRALNNYSFKWHGRLERTDIKINEVR